jgi:sodium-dependent dicarboxylate transporter 2/3/5
VNAADDKRGSLQRVGVVLGPALALATYWLLPDSYATGGSEPVAFSEAGRATAAIAVWMAAWWMTEAIPIYATALMPLGFLPLLRATPIKAAASPYGHELIFLFMGGFILALAMQRWRLDRRISLVVLQWVGDRPEAIVGAFMLVTAGLSMWVSNTATAVMMLPIALGVIDASDSDEGFGIGLLLGIAYAASIGGIGTLVGTPPNLFLASYASESLGVEIGFARWMGVGVPLVVVFLPIAWLLLTRVLHPIRVRSVEGGRRHAREALEALGPISRAEWTVMAVFGVTATLWVTRPLLPLPGLTDPGIAILAALALFVIPVDRSQGVFVMNWETAVKLPWGILLLFGGGLSLAAAIRVNGVGELLGSSVAGWDSLSPLLLMGCVVTLMIFLTEITSNTATAATLLPILGGLAPGLGVDPLLLVVPAAVAASCAFMLPVATPPNAIVFGSERIRLPQMARTGIWLNLIGIVVITGLCYALVIPLLGR